MSDKWVKLAQRLIGLTSEGKLAWQDTSDDDVVQVVIGKNAIELESSGFHDFEIRVRDGSGKVVDRFSDADLSEISNLNYASALNSTYNLIRRQISGTEQVLDDLLDELGKK
ncbi:hypothetical protein N6L24_00545 [Cognatishimia sp. SS12]|uniref:hypothetical protein n=1 Tax=Cognatishimia sp. SS12 TaxID=2979465 RepID=UPI00232E909C|nr:hypothetical protein [Cognatishimia sp. SS12]MDC0736754.1 hypothetical protein [Cognatishimia sp. SS12]